MKYKVIVRDPQEGTEQYFEEASKTGAIEKAAAAADDKSKQVYVEWTNAEGQEGYMNRNGDTNCPGEPW